MKYLAGIMLFQSRLQIGRNAIIEPPRVGQALKNIDVDHMMLESAFACGYGVTASA